MLKLFIALQTRITEIRSREEGQAYVEYGVLLALVAVGLIVTVGFFRDDIVDAFNNIRSAVQDLN